jgi:phenylacetate-coenzyme A ligase PaaK-like adenylate-forming protein
VQWDREKASNRLKAQEELLREYVVHHLYPYSPFYRRRFDGAKIVPRRMGGFSDLAKLEPTSWSEVEADPGSFLLRPTEKAIARFGERRLVMAVTRAKLRGRVSQLNRDLIDPAYKPIHWHLEGEVPVGYSGEDLDRLAEAGRRILELAGIHRDDVMVDVTPPGPNLAYWQVVAAARQAGVSAVHFGPDADPEQVEAATPTALSGPPDVLRSTVQVLEKAHVRLPNLTTLLALGSLVDDDVRAELVAGAQAVEASVEVVAAWAPPGVRALWSECRGGRGFHTYPDMEWIELLEDAPKPGGLGELAWSSLAWHGTAFLRLRTGVQATVDETACATCGRIGPKVNVLMPGGRMLAPPAAATVAAATPVPAAASDFAAPERPVVAAADLRVLDEHPGVTAWQVEYRRVDGHDELLVFIAPAVTGRLGPLFRELDSTLRATQYVLVRPDALQERIARDGSVVDRRLAE